MSHARADIRLNTEAPDNWKVDRLCARLGDGAFRNLIRLWCRVAGFRADGVLEGLTKTDIEGVARWTGPPGAFVEALIDIGFLDVLPTDPATDSATGPVTAFVKSGDRSGDRFGVHGWQEHQPFVARRPERQAASAKANAAKRTGKRRKSLSHKVPTDPVTDSRESGHRNASDPVTPLPPLRGKGEESADAAAAPAGAPPCAAPEGLDVAYVPRPWTPPKPMPGLAIGPRPRGVGRRSSL